MPKVILLPNIDLCYNGDIIKCNINNNLCNILLKYKINIKHFCEKSCACSTCVVLIFNGINDINHISSKEENLLILNQCYTLYSRLSCQVKINRKNLIIKI